MMNLKRLVFVKKTNLLLDYISKPVFLRLYQITIASIYKCVKSFFTLFRIRKYKLCLF